MNNINSKPCTYSKFLEELNDSCMYYTNIIILGNSPISYVKWVCGISYNWLLTSSQLHINNIKSKLSMKIIIDTTFNLPILVFDKNNSL